MTELLYSNLQRRLLKMDLPWHIHSDLGNDVAEVILVLSMSDTPDKDHTLDCIVVGYHNDNIFYYANCENKCIDIQESELAHYHNLEQRMYKLRAFK